MQSHAFPILLSAVSQGRKMAMKLKCYVDDHNRQECVVFDTNSCYNYVIIVLIIVLMSAVDSTTHMVGSYGPKGEEQSFVTPLDEAPSGMLMRGAYK